MLLYAVTDRSWLHGQSLAEQVEAALNDDVELAVKCDADGIHVGQSDMAAGKICEAVSIPRSHLRP